VKNWHREVPGRLQAARIPVISEFISTESQTGREQEQVVRVVVVVVVTSQSILDML